MLIEFASNKFDALYLKPANTDLFDFYKKLGFKTAFFKNEIYAEPKNHGIALIEINNTEDLYKVRDVLSPDISVHLCDTALDYILSNYTAVTDDMQNPQYFALFSIGEDKAIINEVLSKTSPKAFLEQLCYHYNCSEAYGFTVGNDLPCGMIKTNNEFPEKMYMGLDID